MLRRKLCLVYTLIDLRLINFRSIVSLTDPDVYNDFKYSTRSFFSVLVNVRFLQSL